MITDEFFRARLDQMIDLRHQLTVLAMRMPWAQIEASLAPVFRTHGGRGTCFPAADITVRPGAGGAVFFQNVDEHVCPDPISLHAGTPVECDVEVVAIGP
jgi:hypothetical protein